MRSPASKPVLHFVLWSVLGLAACDSGQTDPADEPEVATMIVDINQGVDFTATAAGFELQTLNIGAGTFAINSAIFRREDGVNEALVTTDDFRLEVVGSAIGGPLPSGVSFTRNGPFDGAVSGIANGQSIQVFIGLFHVSEEHFDFGPFPLTVTRSSGGGGAL